MLDHKKLEILLGFGHKTKICSSFWAPLLVYVYVVDEFILDKIERKYWSTTKLSLVGKALVTNCVFFYYVAFFIMIRF